MSEGVTEIQCLADVLLVRIFLHDALLDVHRVGQHGLQLLQVRVIQVEVEQFRPVLLVGDKAMLEHLSIARTNVFVVERTQELSVEDDEACIVEHTDLVFQSVEVDTRLTAYRGVYHSEQCRRNIDEVNATFEGRGREAAQVRHHASTEVDEQ